MPLSVISRVRATNGISRFMFLHRCLHTRRRLRMRLWSGGENKLDSANCLCLSNYWLEDYVIGLCVLDVMEGINNKLINFSFSPTTIAPSHAPSIA